MPEALLETWAGARHRRSAGLRSHRGAPNVLCRPARRMLPRKLGFAGKAVPGSSTCASPPRTSSGTRAERVPGIGAMRSDAGGLHARRLLPYRATSRKCDEEGLLPDQGRLKDMYISGGGERLSRGDRGGVARASRTSRTRRSVGIPTALGRGRMRRRARRRDRRGVDRVVLWPARRFRCRSPFASSRRSAQRARQDPEAGARHRGGAMTDVVTGADDARLVARRPRPGNASDASERCSSARLPRRARSSR